MMVCRCDCNRSSFRYFWDKGVRDRATVEGLQSTEKLGEFQSSAYKHIRKYFSFGRYDRGVSRKDFGCCCVAHLVCDAFIGY